MNRKSLLEFSIGLDSFFLFFCLPFGVLHCWFKNPVWVWFLDSDLIVSVFGIVDLSCWAGLVSETHPSVSGCQCTKSVYAVNASGFLTGQMPKAQIMP